MSTPHPLSLVVSRPAVPQESIVLTDQEREAVIELGLRPTYALESSHQRENDVQMMLSNASAWMRAAEITSAGRAGRIPHELRGEIAGLLDEAIPEAQQDLESTTRNFQHWRAGDVRHGFPQLAAPQTEALYREYIAHDRHMLHALSSVAAKLDEARAG